MRRASLCVGAVLAASFGCSSSDAPAPASPPATFTAIYATSFPRMTKGQCTFCHGLPPNDKSNGMLSVGSDKDAAFAALVGKKSTSSKCSGKTLVAPGEPDASLLLQKVTQPSCGDHMPLGGDSLTADAIEMIRSWIAAGAPNN